MYAKPSAQIEINGFLPDKIELQRGTRQGCPVSYLH